MTVTVRSFAKINLGLRIGAARDDGFHELLTVYQTIALHDVIRVSVERGSGRGPQIEIRCTDPRVPTDESNTCFRMARLAMQALHAKGKVVVEIEKRLPVQGGLGGASSNAVATLLGLERALEKTLPAIEKLRLASEIGSDVSLFLVGGTVLGVGRGEQVYPLPDLPALACVVLTPEVGVSTPKAFAEWDRVRAAQGLKPQSSGSLDAALKRRSSTVAQAAENLAGEALAPARRKTALSGMESAELRSAGQPGAAVPTQTGPKLTLSAASDRMSVLSRGLSAWLSEGFLGQSYSSAPSRAFGRRGRAGNPLLWLVRAGIENDFEQVVFPEHPELREGKRALESAGAKYASLSGSGSTLYGLFASKEASTRAAGRLRKQGWAARATTTVTRRRYWRQIFDC
jgi:4-diphosphocytidyl-2-C-methyl-D-erythritol kinase